VALENAQRSGDLAKAGEIAYGKIPTLQKKLSELEAATQGMANDTVTEHDIASIVSRWTGIPVDKMLEGEREKLLTMESVLSQTVVGQKEAVAAVSQAVRRSRAGLQDTNRPIGSFLFLGPTGVGKTELSKALAQFLFDDKAALLRIDMSEYMDKTSVNRIIGSPPAFVGYDDSTLLDQIRRKPYCVLLMDEIEKAHPDVYNIFLQAFDDGHMTDSHGRKVSFKNCIILMTSNVGTRIVKDFGTGVGFATKHKSEDRTDEIKGILEKELKKKFAPEFINRIEEIIYFNDLGKDEIRKILFLELDKSIARLKELGFSAEIDETIIEKLIEVGYDPQYGARPMKRAIQKWVDDYLIDILLESPTIGTTFRISYDSENDVTKIESEKVEVEKKKKSTSRKKKDE
jgi:ATP-dependent Clp protease ATP-binding subunit ClpB